MPKSIIAKQQRIRRLMSDASFQEVYCCAHSDPTLTMLNRRRRAAEKLSDLADELLNSIWSQIDEVKKTKNAK